MNARAIARVALLCVVASSLAKFGLDRAQRGSEPSSGPPGAEAPIDAPAARVLVTYFTTDVRCASCRTIEELSRRAVEEGFRDEVRDGTVVFRVINTDRPEHAHFVDEYQLTNKTVIVSQRKDGAEVEFTDRQDVWLLLDEPEPFFEYVRQPIRAYLAAG